MTALLLVAALGGLGAVIAGTAMTTAWLLGRRTSEPPTKPTVKEMADAMYVSDAATWTKTSSAITAGHPLYTRHAQIALSFLNGREVTRRG